jgi:hypothetical protein
MLVCAKTATPIIDQDHDALPRPYPLVIIRAGLRESMNPAGMRLKLQKGGFIALLSTLILGLVAPTLLGMGLDRQFDSVPVMTAFCTVPGIIVTTFILTRAMQARFERIAPRDPGEGAP